MALLWLQPSPPWHYQNSLQLQSEPSPNTKDAIINNYTDATLKTHDTNTVNAVNPTVAYLHDTNDTVGQGLASLRGLEDVKDAKKNSNHNHAVAKDVKNPNYSNHFNDNNDKGDTSPDLSQTDFIGFAANTDGKIVLANTEVEAYNKTLTKAAKNDANDNVNNHVHIHVRVVDKAGGCIAIANEVEFCKKPSCEMNCVLTTPPPRSLFLHLERLANTKKVLVQRAILVHRPHKHKRRLKSITHQRLKVKETMMHIMD